MGWTHARALRLVRRLELIGPCHGSIPGDLDRVQAAFAREPELAAALNALDPARVEETPQGAAAHLGCREILTELLARGVRLDPFMAGALGEREALRAFLCREPPLANARGAHGIHLLNHAPDPETARLLLAHGADPHTVVYAPWGWTPLHQAAHQGKRELLELLAAAGGVRIAGPEGTTPLHAAARMGHRPIVEWWLARGLPLDARGQGSLWQDKTAFAIALEHGHTSIAALLREHGG
jgi:ankyrin repeat protein